MTPLINDDIMLAIIGVLCCAGGIGVTITHWLLSRYDVKHPAVNVNELHDKLDNLNKAVVELAWLRLLELHEQAMTQGWMDADRRRIVERLYTAYHLIGGNGTGTMMIEDIRELPTSPPHNKEN